jgi:hypothetical protein
MTGTLLTEANAAKPKQASKGIWRAKLISADVQGSTGFYPAAVLERDGASAFPAGTHVYFDHPSERETWDRPERSVRDLAGALIEAAQYVQNDPEGPGLYARVQFFPDVRGLVESMAAVVGMSIRAAGTLEETDSGTIITAILQGVSVDIVTHAGAGGRLVEMTESAKLGSPTVVPVIQAGGLTESDRALIAQTNQGIATLTTNFDKFLTSLQEAKDARDKAAADAATLTVGQITAKLTESGLPAASQKRLAEAYVSGQDFDAAVTDEKAYVQSITEATKGGKPAANGQQAGTVETDNGQQISEAVKADAGLFDSLFG